MKNLRTTTRIMTERGVITLRELMRDLCACERRTVCFYLSVYGSFTTCENITWTVTP